MRIEVTQEDIDKGRGCSPTQCPVARAIKREMPDAIISVGTKDVCISRDDGPFRALWLTPEITDWIQTYDVTSVNDRTPFAQPFAFELDDLKTKQL